MDVLNNLSRPDIVDLENGAHIHHAGLCSRSGCGLRLYAYLSGLELLSDARTRYGARLHCHVHVDARHWQQHCCRNWDRRWSLHHSIPNYDARPERYGLRFTAFAAGIASGLQAYAAAIAGTAIFLIAALALDFTAFGARRHFDGLVRFSVSPDGDAQTQIAALLKAHCDSFVLVTLREAAQGKRMEHAYQISVPNPDARNHLVLGLQALNGIQDVTLLMQEPTLDL